MRSLVRHHLRRLDGLAFDRCVGERLTEPVDGGPTPRARRLSPEALGRRLTSGAGLVRSPPGFVALLADLVRRGAFVVGRR